VKQFCSYGKSLGDSGDDSEGCVKNLGSRGHVSSNDITPGVPAARPAVKFKD